MNAPNPPIRSLTVAQREDISAGLEDSIPGPVSMTAPASDNEAVAYQGEIASVLEDAGCDVEIVNPTKAAEEEPQPGIEMTIKEQTVRPGHAYRIVRAFRHAGITIATKISASRRRNDTLYITVGTNDAPPDVPQGLLANLLTKSKTITDDLRARLRRTDDA